MRFPGRGAIAGMLRSAGLVSVAALPFACTVYGPSLLGSAGPAGTSGDPGGQVDATVGGAPDDQAMSGGGASHAAGAIGEGAAGGAALETGGTSSGGAAALDTAGEGGAGAETGSGGSGAGVGGTSTGGTSTGGVSTGGASGILGVIASYPCESANGAVLVDASGHGKNASLANGAGGSPVGFSFGSGMVGNALALSASNQAYLSLPKGIVAQLTEATIVTWVKLKSGAAFQRIFDFGIDTSTFMYLANSGSDGTVRFRIVSASLNKNQILEGADALPVGKWIHVAVTIGDSGLSIYLDGAQIAQKSPAALRPSDLGDTGNNFIGRSPFAADPYLDGQIDEFRIYNRVLSPEEINSLANAR